MSLVAPTSPHLPPLWCRVCDKRETAPPPPLLAMQVEISKPILRLSDIQAIVPVYKQTWLRVTERYDLNEESGNNVIEKYWHSMLLDVLAFGIVAKPRYDMRHAYFAMNPDRTDGPYWQLSPAFKTDNVMVEVFVGEKPDISKPIGSFCEGYAYVSGDQAPDETPDFALDCVID